MEWIKGKGRVNVDVRGGRLVVDVGYDLAAYYNWLIMREFWIKPTMSKFQPHISVVLPNVPTHKNVDLNKARQWQGDVINFEYNPDIIIGGQTKDFRNFWMKVRSHEIDAMKKVLGLENDKYYRGLHLTISNTKTDAGTERGVAPWWPEMITISNVQKNPKLPVPAKPSVQALRTKQAQGRGKRIHQGV